MQHRGRRRGKKQRALKTVTKRFFHPKIKKRRKNSTLVRIQPPENRCSAWWCSCSSPTASACSFRFLCSFHLKHPARVKMQKSGSCTDRLSSMVVEERRQRRHSRCAIHDGSQKSIALPPSPPIPGRNQPEDCAHAKTTGRRARTHTHTHRVNPFTRREASGKSGQTCVCVCECVCAFVNVIHSFWYRQMKEEWNKPSRPKAKESKQAWRWRWQWCCWDEREAAAAAAAASTEVPRQHDVLFWHHYVVRGAVCSCRKDGAEWSNTTKMSILSAHLNEND